MFFSMSRLKVSIKVCPIVQVLRQNCHKIFLQKKDKEKLPDILTFFYHIPRKSLKLTHFIFGMENVKLILFWPLKMTKMVQKIYERPRNARLFKEIWKSKV